MALHDHQLPAAGVLLGDGARELVEAAVSAHGGTVVALERRQAVYRPQRSLTVRYRADVSWSGGPTRNETIVAVADRRGPLPDTLVMQADDLEVSVFRYPADPKLPGLPIATMPTEAADALGWSTPPVLEAKTYRPLDRAVVRARSAEIGERYLKVLRPKHVPALVRRLNALADRAPVAPVLDVRPELGLIVLDAVPGVTLRDALRNGATELPDPEEVLAALACATSVPQGDVPVARSPVQRAEGFVHMLAAIVPSSRKRLERLLDRMGADDEPPSVVVHGDFHPAQVMVEGTTLHGLLDFDDLGLGRPVQDLATFLGHLANLASTDRSGALRPYLGRSLLAFEAVVEPHELHRQTAAVILGLATGPHRTQQADWQTTTRRRIALAERWLAGDVRTLRSAS